MQQRQQFQIQNFKQQEDQSQQYSYQMQSSSLNSTPGIHSIKDYYNSCQNENFMNNNKFYQEVQSVGSFHQQDQQQDHQHQQLFQYHMQSFYRDGKKIVRTIKKPNSNYLIKNFVKLNKITGNLQFVDHTFQHTNNNVFGVLNDINSKSNSINENIIWMPCQQLHHRAVYNKQKTQVEKMYFSTKSIYYTLMLLNNFNPKEFIKLTQNRQLQYSFKNNMQYKMQNYYEFYIVLDNELTTFFVDSYVPVSQLNNNEIYTPNFQGAFWGSIVQKLLAKLKGNYHLLKHQATVKEFYQMLNFSIKQKIKPKQIIKDDFNQQFRQIQKVQLYIKSKLLQGCILFFHTINNHFLTSLGLIPNHSYFIHTILTYPSPIIAFYQFDQTHQWIGKYSKYRIDYQLFRNQVRVNELTRFQNYMGIGDFLNLVQDLTVLYSVNQADVSLSRTYNISYHLKLNNISNYIKQSNISTQSKQLQSLNIVRAVSQNIIIHPNRENVNQKQYFNNENTSINQILIQNKQLIFKQQQSQDIKFQTKQKIINLVNSYQKILKINNKFTKILLNIKLNTNQNINLLNLNALLYLYDQQQKKLITITKIHRQHKYKNEFIIQITQNQIINLIKQDQIDKMFDLKLLIMVDQFTKQSQQQILFKNQASIRLSQFVFIQLSNDQYKQVQQVQYSQNQIDRVLSSFFIQYLSHHTNRINHSNNRYQNQQNQNNQKFIINCKKINSPISVGIISIKNYQIHEQYQQNKSTSIKIIFDLRKFQKEGFYYWKVIDTHRQILHMDTIIRQQDKMQIKLLLNLKGQNNIYIVFKSFSCEVIQKTKKQFPPIQSTKISFHE